MTTQQRIARINELRIQAQSAQDRGDKLGLRQIEEEMHRLLNE